MNKRNNILLLIPIFGAALFVMLYFVATIFYPGGSQVDKNAVGFSWLNNYWCNLLNDNAINGQPNTAKPIAIAGMIILCVTLSLFWLLFPLYINMGKKYKIAIQTSGLLSMGAASLLFTNFNHDLITNLASLFGLLATIGVYIGLYKLQWYRLFAFGLMNILLVALNNYVYYNQELIVYLPIIQKISFATFLIWICSINLKLYKRVIVNNNLS